MYRVPWSDVLLNRRDLYGRQVGVGCESWCGKTVFSPNRHQLWGKMHLSTFLIPHPSIRLEPTDHGSCPSKDQVQMVLIGLC